MMALIFSRPLLTPNRKSHFELYPNLRHVKTSKNFYVRLCKTDNLYTISMIRTIKVDLGVLE